MKRNTQRIKELIRGDETPSVYSARFTFRSKEYDQEFKQLNDAIDEVATLNPGFLGKERWSNEEENKKSVVYYWDSLEALKKFSRNPDHRKAKQQYEKWYSGYEIIIANVLEFRSDGGL